MTEKKVCAAIAVPLTESTKPEVIVTIVIVIVSVIIVIIEMIVIIVMIVTIVTRAIVKLTCPSRSASSAQTSVSHDHLPLLQVEFKFDSIYI